MGEANPGEDDKINQDNYGLFFRLYQTLIILNMIINKLKEAIEIALENKNYYAALALALSMPDICGKLEYPTKFSKERFKIWFDKYLKKYYETEIMGQKYF